MMRFLFAKLSLSALSTVTVPAKAWPQSSLMALKNASCDGIDDTSVCADADDKKRLETTTTNGNFMVMNHAGRWSRGQNTLTATTFGIILS